MNRTPIAAPIVGRARAKAGTSRACRGEARVAPPVAP